MNVSFTSRWYRLWLQGRSERIQSTQIKWILHGKSSNIAFETFLTAMKDLQLSTFTRNRWSVISATTTKKCEFNFSHLFQFLIHEISHSLHYTLRINKTCSTYRIVKRKWRYFQMRNTNKWWNHNTIIDNMCCSIFIFNILHEAIVRERMKINTYRFELVYFSCISDDVFTSHPHPHPLLMIHWILSIFNVYFFPPFLPSSLPVHLSMQHWHCESVLQLAHRSWSTSASSEQREDKRVAQQEHATKIK